MAKAKLEFNNETNYTSLELSKKLQENWFEKITDSFRCKNKNDIWYIFQNDYYKDTKKYDIYIPAYDILNDLCVRYAKEMLGEKNDIRCGAKLAYIWHPMEIIAMKHTVKKEYLEKYIREHCLYNSKNKDLWTN